MTAKFYGIQTGTQGIKSTDCGSCVTVMSHPLKVCHFFHIGCQPGVKQQSTILVEIFVNEKIQSWDKTTQQKIIGSVTKPIQDIIVKKQTSSLPPRYVLL